MTKVVLIYGTGSGNTERVAIGIIEGIEAAGAEAILKKYDGEFVDLSDADAVLVGSPTYNTKPMPFINHIFDGKQGDQFDGKVGAAFGSFGRDGKAVQIITEKMKEHSMDVIDPGMAVFTRPNGEKLEMCRKFGESIVGKIKGL
ncbi:MAG TPA: hypothetical protein C5S50_07100 [Methanosarcinaceae archaeon]|nr:hypothetical protein [Methanosarcinaceae archaeon]